MGVCGSELHIVTSVWEIVSSGQRYIICHILRKSIIEHAEKQCRMSYDRREWEENYKRSISNSWICTEFVYWEQAFVRAGNKLISVQCVIRGNSGECKEYGDEVCQKDNMVYVRMCKS